MEVGANDPTPTEPRPGDATGAEAGASVSSAPAPAPAPVPTPATTGTETPPATPTSGPTAAASAGGGGGAWNRKNPAIRRIMADIRELSVDPSDQYAARPNEDNMFEWHFVIRGPVGTDFEGGRYHGKILLPADYPYKPPNIVFLTPNGRWETRTKICLSISAFHPELWQPAWGVRTILEALISFMPTPADGAVGAVDATPEVRRKLARESLAYSHPSMPALPELGTGSDKRNSQYAAAVAQMHFHAPVGTPAATPTATPTPTPATGTTPAPASSSSPSPAPSPSPSRSQASSAGGSAAAAPSPFTLTPTPVLPPVSLPPPAMPPSPVVAPATGAAPPPVSESDAPPPPTPTTPSGRPIPSPPANRPVPVPRQVREMLEAQAVMRRTDDVLRRASWAILALLVAVVYRKLLLTFTSTPF